MTTTLSPFSDAAPPAAAAEEAAAAAAATAAEEETAPPPAGEATEWQPLHYMAADLPAALAPSRFLGLEKTGGLYTARLAEPLVVQTPPLVLASPLDDEDGNPLPHCHVTLPAVFRHFVQQAEELVLEACLVNKAGWFRRHLDDDSLRASFKPFCKPGGALKIKVPRDALVFDSDGMLLRREEVEPGTSVRCLLELSRVCFGRTEFGAMWSLVQAQCAPARPAPPPPPRCMIDPTADDDDHQCGGGDHRPAEADSEVHEFL